MVLNFQPRHIWNIILLHYFKVGVIYGAQAQDVMIVINLNRRERKRPTTDLYKAYSCGILFSLHQISLLSPESAHLASLCKAALPDSTHLLLTHPHG